MRIDRSNGANARSNLLSAGDEVMIERKKYDTLALVSGGLDSTTMIYEMNQDGIHARLLYLDFGTPATVREKAAVKLFAYTLGYPLDILDLSGFATLHLGYLWPSIVSGPELDVGKPMQADFPISRADGRLSSGFGVIVSVGLYAAMILDTASLSLAIIREQFEALPELGAGLAAAGKLASAVNPGIKIDVVTPLASLSKVEVVQRAIKFGVPIHMTWSCALGGERPCERCQRCLARHEAIAAAGIAIAAGPPAIDPPNWGLGDIAK
jgi:7-cyano-7-deazaguanine synthase